MTKVVCKRCVVDSTVPDVIFDSDGICNHCHVYDSIDARYENTVKLSSEYEAVIKKIKVDGKGRDYDCLVGLSGGVDSSYTLLKAIDHGLRPLVVHFDNGWNSDKAIKNIKKMLTILDVDLYTYVVDWQEFRDLQLSFLRASVSDAEIPTDIAIKSVLYKLAAKNGIKYILYSGSNHKTEGRMPRDWTYMDGKYIKSVHKKYGELKRLKSYPNYTLRNLLYFHVIKRIKLIRLFNFIEFNNNQAVKELENRLGWEYYGGKHYESVYTKFFQSYILPVKHNIDKRIVHYSALVRSGQITREQALERLKECPYDLSTIEQDKNYIMKKLEISKDEFESILSRDPKSYKDYSTYDSIRSRLLPLIKLLKRLKLWPTIA